MYLHLGETKNVKFTSAYRDLLKCFTTAELMNWTHLQEVYKAEMSTGKTATGVFDFNTEKGKERWDDLRKRVVEHVSRTHRPCEGDTVLYPI